MWTSRGDRVTGQDCCRQWLQPLTPPCYLNLRFCNASYPVHCLSEWLPGWQDNVLSHHLGNYLWVGPLSVGLHIQGVSHCGEELLCYTSTMSLLLVLHTLLPGLCKANKQGDKHDRACLSVPVPKLWLAHISPGLLWKPVPAGPQTQGTRASPGNEQTMCSSQSSSQKWLK